MTETPPSGEPRPSALNPRRLLMTIAVALAVAGAALGVAAVMDEPVGEGPRDPEPIVAGIVTPEGEELTGGDSQLPPLAIVLTRGLSPDIAGLPAEQQVARLREGLATDASVRRYLELGRAYMELSDVSGAEEAFREASRLRPADPEPLTGLAMARAVGGDTGLDQAAGELESLAIRFPRSQVVRFNQGWLALYRTDVRTVRSSWETTVELGRTTALGRLAASLLEQIQRAESGG